ncbi:hypothetical protein B0H16DRAFT_1778190 [Mycena metata]|uniref:F-box domain-containing protein n=1 Tax=Mycena metata TaxID=1033252 RepID=A0AAD7HUK0_9AGAR|nr:hypothetical protein B0H16DRAFT_1778190 [Mycena metata]
MPLPLTLGRLSNRDTEFKTQNILVERNGLLAFGPFITTPTLPPEILSEIFVHCLPAWPRPDPDQAPLLLCRVSRRFREVAVSTPRLWSSLCVDFGDYNYPCESIPSLWLSRARSVPLSLWLYDDWDKKVPCSLERSLFPIVIDLSEQWRLLVIGGSFWASLFHDGSLNGKVPLLEELSIDDFGSHPVILHDAPKLPNEPTRYVNIPFSLEILKNSPNLMQASFNLFTFDFESPHLPASEYRHARLQRLVLSVSEDDDRALPISLLDLLETPALNDLTVVLDPRQPVIVGISPLLSFLSQSALRLHTLALAHITAPMEDLIECLKLTPSLAHFKFRCAHPSDFDILFTKLTGCAKFLPKLEGLLAGFDEEKTPPSLATSVAVEMLCWRWAAVGIAQLKSFRLVHGPKVSDPPLFLGLLKSDADFQRLQEHGMLLYAGLAEDNDVFGDFH